MPLPLLPLELLAVGESGEPLASTDTEKQMATVSAYGCERAKGRNINMWPRHVKNRHVSSARVRKREQRTSLGLYAGSGCSDPDDDADEGANGAGESGAGRGSVQRWRNESAAKTRHRPSPPAIASLSPEWGENDDVMRNKTPR